jgi:hypothetical protein
MAGQRPNPHAAGADYVGKLTKREWTEEVNGNSGRNGFGHERNMVTLVMETWVQYSRLRRVIHESIFPDPTHQALNPIQPDPEILRKTDPIQHDVYVTSRD